MGGAPMVCGEQARATPPGETAPGALLGTSHAVEGVALDAAVGRGSQLQLEAGLGGLAVESRG